MRELMSGGTTVILVSHSIEQIERMCNKVTWLEKGRVRMTWRHAHGVRRLQGSGSGGAT